MTDGIADNGKDLCLTIDAIDAIDIPQVCGGQLAGRRAALIIKRTVGQERAARRPEDARHRSGLTHRDRDDFAIIELSMSKQIEDGEAVDRVVRLDRDLNN